MSLNLSGTYKGEPSTRPPSCTAPGQPTTVGARIPNKFGVFWIKGEMERKINMSPSCVIQIQISLYNECVTMKGLIQKRITEYGNIEKKILCVLHVF